MEYRTMTKGQVNCGNGSMIDNQRFNDQHSQTEYDPENYKI